jgi:hypothetical protein
MSKAGWSRGKRLRWKVMCPTRASTSIDEWIRTRSITVHLVPIRCELEELPCIRAIRMHYKLNASLQRYQRAWGALDLPTSRSCRQNTEVTTCRQTAHTGHRISTHSFRTNRCRCLRHSHAHPNTADLGCLPGITPILCWLRHLIAEIPPYRPQHPSYLGTACSTALSFPRVSTPTINANIILGTILPTGS